MLTTDEWVKQLNQIGAELDGICATLHPTAWKEDPDIEKLKKKWRTLVKQPTNDDVQLELFGREEVGCDV